MVTAATLNKAPYFKENLELDLLHDLLLELAEHYKWRLEAWAVFANHYHFIAHSQVDPTSLGKLIAHLHASSARKLNNLHQIAGRKVWYQYWDSQITFQKSYLARLNYVIKNPERHKIVTNASQYKWCSASWFENNTSKAHYETVMGLNSDSINIRDDF